MQELDPFSDNNTAQASVTPESVWNVAPMFRYERSVNENAPSGTYVGGAISVLEPDANDTLTFSLAGNGSDRFDLEVAGGAAQIVVAQGATLNYQETQVYDLTLGVSDGKDQNGNPSASIDDRAALRIAVVNDPDDDPTPVVTLAADPPAQQNVNSSVTLTWTLDDLPVGASVVSWHLLWRDAGGDLVEEELVLNGGALATTVTWPQTQTDPGSRTYEVRLSYRLNGQDLDVKSNSVTINWTN